MTNQNIEALQRAVLADIVNILNRKKGIPVSFNTVTLGQTSDSSYQGSVGCSEAGGRKWTLEIKVSLAGQTVEWDLEIESEPHRFQWHPVP